jgi:mono/diheme cytochrome c family protein
MGAKVGPMALSLIVLLGVGTIGVAFALETTPGKKTVHIDREKVERGRYLARIGGCNDCHTEGYLQSEGKTPESQWLTGSSFGWRGLWGTTYAANLRLFVNTLTEKQWIEVARHLKARPPMPWYNLNHWSDDDLKALYQFIRYLGPAGKQAPAFVPPGQEPSTPYALFPAPPK